MRTAIFVAGMHRSGTSCLTRVLGLLGGQMPSSAGEGDPTNPTGHWEPDHIVNLNMRILQDFNSGWDDWSDIGANVASARLSKNYELEISDLLVREFGDSSMIIIKEPRLCRLLPIYSDVMAQREISVRYVLPIRNPLEVAASLIQRDALELDYCLLLWLRNVLDAEFYSRHEPRSFLTYDSLLNDWRPVVDRISSDLDLNWPDLNENASNAISAYLSTEYRHAIADDAVFLDRQDCGGCVQRVYQILLTWAQSGENGADYATLDEIRERLNKVSASIGSVVYFWQGAKGTNRTIPNDPLATLISNLI